jgi:NAD(P)-dependent dehydrogenase (short-subunit alcohol dehydrogenase family)
MKTELDPMLKKQKEGRISGGHETESEASIDEQLSEVFGDDDREVSSEADKDEKERKEGEKQGKGQGGQVEKEGRGKVGGERGKCAGVKVEYIPLDLSSFQSTIDCVRAFKEKNLPLHILINNAAVAWTPFGE